MWFSSLQVKIIFLDNKVFFKSNYFGEDLLELLIEST